MFTFILMGNRPYFHLLEVNLAYISKHYPDAPVMFYDWGLKRGQQRRLKDRFPTLEIIEWSDQISRRGNLFNVGEPERIRRGAFSYVARLPYPKRKLGKWCLKRLPQSRIARRIEAGALRFQSILLHKILCIQHCAARAGDTPLAFLDADAILIRPIDEMLDADYDVALTVVRPKEFNLGVDQCFAINSGVIFFGASSEARRLFIEAWWETATRSPEWMAGQTAITRILQRAGSDVFRPDHSFALSLEGTRIRVKLLPTDRYNFFYLEEIAESSLDDVRIVHFKARSRHRQTFGPLLKIVERKIADGGTVDESA